MKSEIQWSESRSVLSDSLGPHGLYSPWNSPARILEWVSLVRLQEIFPTQGLSPTLQAEFLPAEPQGSPRVLEWVAYPFSRGSSRSRNQNGVSCIAGRFFTNWAIREAQGNIESIQICRELVSNLPKRISAKRIWTNLEITTHGTRSC